MYFLIVFIFILLWFLDRDLRTIDGRLSKQIYDLKQKIEELESKQKLKKKK